MSGEIPDKEHSELKGVIDRLTECLIASHPNMVMNEAMHLTYQTDYNPSDVIRHTASKLLDSDDDKMYHHVFRYFEWEANTIPDASSVDLLVAKATTDIDKDTRFYIGTSELSAALDYMQRVVEKSDRPMDGECIEKLLEAFNLLNNNSNLLMNEYRQAGMVFNQHILEAAMIYDGIESATKRDSIDELLVHVTRATEDLYPTTSGIAAAHIKNQKNRDIVESEKYSRKLWGAIETGDYATVNGLLSPDYPDISLVVWKNVIDVYGLGQYDRNWLNGFIDSIDRNRPDYFVNLTQDLSREVECSTRAAYTAAIAARYDIVDRIFSTTMSENSIDLIIAADVARAYGARDDYIGISRLIKIEGFDTDIKEVISENFKFGTENPHATSGQY